MLEINYSSEELVLSLSPESPTVFPIHLPEHSDFEKITQLNDTDYYNMNYSALVYSEYSLRHSPGIITIFCIAYSLVFVLGILGNSLVISVVIRSPRMRTVTNFFIVNLACADILVIIFCLPATLLGNIFVPWILGLFMCKSVTYLQGVSVISSINTLVAISIDRFLAICYPLKCQMTPRNAKRIIFIIWLFSVTITLPWALYFQLIPLHPSNPDIAVCAEIWPHDEAGTYFFLIANMGFCYLIPLTIISVCYVGIWIKVSQRSIPGETKGTNADVLMQRSKLKVVKMMVAVVVLFAISWLPLYIVFTIVKFGGEIEAGSYTSEVLAVMAPFAQWLGASNSCINPVLYAFFNKKFRKGFYAIVKSKSCCGTLRFETSATKGTVLRSTFKSRETQSEYVSAQV